MNRFIKKNLFLVGVLAISGLIILVLLGMSAMKFFEMNKYQSATKKMTDDLDELNNRMRTPIPPFKKNIKLVQEDAAGYRNLKDSIKSYFGMTLQPALTVFVTSLRTQSMNRLTTLFEQCDKSAEFNKMRKDFSVATLAWQKVIEQCDRTKSELQNAYRNIKKLEDQEDIQENKARVSAEQQKKISALKLKLSALTEARNKSVAALNAEYGKLLTYITQVKGSEKYADFAKSSKEDAREIDFYYGICQQNLTEDSLRDTFAQYWNQVKDLQGPRKQTYRNFRLERGATLDQPAVSANKPVLWDTDMWNNAIREFVKEAQKDMLEVIDEKNLEEVFLSSFGLERNLDKSTALIEAHSHKMSEAIKEYLEKGNIFIAGVDFNQTALELVKSNKGFVDTGSTRNTSTAQGVVSTSSDGNSSTTGMITAEPSDVIRNWEIIADIAKRMVSANIDSLEKFSYVNLAGDTSNGNYKKFSYVITIVSRESQIRNFMQLLADAYKDNRLYVIKRFSMQKQEDQIQDIIDYASGIIGKDDEGQENKEGASSEGGNKTQIRPAFFKEKKSYPECVAGRSTLCRVNLVVDYVELTEGKLK